MKASVLLGVLLLQVVTCGGISVSKITNELDKVENEIDNKLFLYETPSFQWIPSNVYKYADLRESLDVMATEGVANKKFYIGEDVTNGHVYGMVNIAAFLAQSMKETIKYDACDENSWDLVGGKYPLSNACGQLGQSYQDYHCSEEEKHMECPVDPNMSITAVTHAKWYGAPAPLYCGPKTDEQPFSGFWDYGYECNKSWANPPEYCDVYEGQKAGKFDQSRPYANTAGRTDVEGCCWWGRGVIQTTGVCNFGKLNYYLGARAAEEGRPSRYPTIDFCKDPEQICSSSAFKELKWVAGMFYWMESVQSYNEGGWKYMDELAKFVEGGMQGTAFIDAVSGIVNRGCHNPPCGTGALDGGHERSQNFKKVLETFFAGSPPEVSGSTTTTSNVDEPSTPSSPTSSTPSSPSPPTQINGGDKWYPDYAANWAEGKCLNAYPAPSGRPHYDSQKECCDKAYGNQASGVCVGAISSSSEENLSPTPQVVQPVAATPQPTSRPQIMIEGPASPSQDLTTDTEASPQPPSSTVFVVEETLRPTNKPVASFSIEEPGGRWYPDYNPIWALGQCINVSPAPSGRPNYESQSECCKKAYGGQASGACVGYTTETVSKLETYYPDYNGNWALGRCTNDYPAPSGRPQYTSQKECCEKAYGGQASGACMSDVALTTPTDALDEFYPNYDPLWSKGICTNKAPLPHGRPTYSSQSECCEFAYRGQASGACVNHSPGDTAGDNPVSFAESFSSEFMTPHAAVRSSFITYSCGDSSTIPYETAILDILFDYEISLPQNVQASHILPSLKKQIMDSLATSLNCQLTQRRGLRKVEGVLLGFQSVDGSDVIDGDKASCIKSQQLDGEACYPVIGHIGAIMKFEASNDEVLFVKSDVLNNIRTRMETESIVDVDSSGIKYVSEHDDSHEEHDSIQLDDGFQQQAQSGNADDLTTNNRSWIEVAFWLLGCVCGVGATLAVIKRRERRRNNLIDSPGDDLPICLEVEDTDHTNDFSDRSISSQSHDRGNCDSSTEESFERAPHTHELQPQHGFKQGQSMSLDEYINETRACPSVFAAIDVVQPSVDNDQKIENNLDKQVEMDENDEEESNIDELNSSQREEVGDQQVERGDDKKEDEENDSTHLPPVI